jgi:hypothetical protein
MWVGGQRHTPAALPPGKTWYPLYRRLVGPHYSVWTGAENLAPTGIQSPDRPARRVAIPTKLPRPTHLKFTIVLNFIFILMGTEWPTIITGQTRQHAVCLFESQQIYNVIKRLRITLRLLLLSGHVVQ